MAYSQEMTFADICMEVQQLRFNSSQSDSIKRWVNDRYAALWNADEWVFKYAKANVTATAGSSSISALPDDFGIALGLWRDDGFPLHWMPPKAFENLYQGATGSAAPEFYTIIDDEVLVGPISNETSSSFLLLYERRMTPLLNDADIPAIPSQHHYLLVYGALYVGLALYNDFTFQFVQAQWNQGIAEMRLEWLNDQRGDVTQWGRDTVEALPTYWGI